MKTKIIVNPDAFVAEKVREKVKANDGYCPCMLEKTEDTKCPCVAFLKSEDLGECHCGLYCRVEK